MRNLERHGETVGHLYDTLPIPDSEAASGPLRGVPFGIKDLFDLQGRTTRAGSVALRKNAPAEHTAIAVARLQAAGAIPVATLAMDELAHGFTGVNERLGTCRNPHDLHRIAGGSSGGSAAAVALGDLSVTLGSDTNGSVRVPASLCGVFGVKPGRGRIPVHGIVPFAPTLDHVGFLASNAQECRRILDVLCDPQPRRPTNSTIARLGLLSDAALVRWASPAAQHVTRASFAALGGTKRVDLPPLQHAMASSLTITAVEGAEVHLRLLQDRRDELGRSARVGLAAGAVVRAVDLVTARRYRRWLRHVLDDVFKKIDVLVLPTTPGWAPRIEEEEIETGTAGMRGREPYLGIFTIPFSLVGLPAVSVPVAFGQVLPLGVQLVGRPGSEHLLLSVAECLEDSLGVTPHAEVA